MKKYIIIASAILLVMISFIFLRSQKSELLEKLSLTSQSETPTAPAVANAAAKVEEVAKLETQAREKEREKFEDNGWKEVSEDEPDMDVVKLNPAALTTKEEEIQVQLQTNVYKGDKLLNIKEIIKKSSEFKTKYVALESLARSRDPLAQSIMIELYPQLNNKLQDEVIKKMKPTSLTDNSANFLFDIMASTSTSTTQKEMASLNIIMMDLADKPKVSDELVNRVPKSWRPSFDQLLKRF